MILSSNDPGTRGKKTLLGPVKEGTSEPCYRIWSLAWHYECQAYHSIHGCFHVRWHHPHLLLEWPSVFTLLLSSILAVASVWHLFLPWLTLFCPHPRSSQLYRNTMRTGYTTDPLYALVSVSKYYYSLSLAPSHSSGGRKHCGFNLRVEKN